MRTVARFALFVAAVWLAESTPSWAQRATGSVVGTVRDISGSVVPGTEIGIVNTGTGITSKVRSDDEGNYVFPRLQPGTYELSALLSGFKRFVSSAIVLNVDGTVRVDVTLEPGSVQDTVEVVAQAPLVNTDDASLSQVVAHKLLVDLPLNGRNYQQLELLSPGTVSTGGAESLFSTTGTTIVVANGGRPGKSAFLVDGADAYDYRSRTSNFAPALDAIEEFRHQKSLFSAEYGDGGSAVSVVVKSGTNQLRGALWEFLRNDAFDARGFFSTQKPNPLKRNQFGGTIGGPVLIPSLYNGRNRTFFFFSYEGLRVRTAGNSFATLPQPEFWNGNFAALANRLYDPATTRPAAAAGQFTRDPFPGNVIPAGRLDSVAKYFQPFFPVPNRAGLTSNYFQTVPSRDNNSQVLTRIDHQISPKDTLFVRYARDWGDGIANGALFPFLTGAESRRDTVNHGIVTYTHTFGAATILEARASASRTHNFRFAPSQGEKDHTAASGITGFEGMSNVFPGFPDLAFSGYAGLAGGTFRPLNGPRNSFYYVASVATVQGSHTLKAGANLRWYQQNVTNGGEPRGNFSFNGTYTTNPASTRGTGDGFADFLLGRPFSGSRYRPPGWFYLRFRTYDWYLQDDWKATPRLTLNLGLRYELHMPAFEKYGGMGTFLPEARDGRGAIVVRSEEAIRKPVLSAVPLALPFYEHLIVTAQQAGITSRLREVDRNNFAPRFGFAWRPRGGTDTVLRGGYGIYYLPYDGGRQTEWSTVPFIVRETATTNTVPIPTRSTAQYFPAGSTFDPRPTLTANSVRFRISYLQQWSMGVQQRLPYHTVAEVSYVGAKGTKLERIRELNSPPPGPGDVEARRPYPEFRSISGREASASSVYHSLQVKVERRWTSGLQMLLSYTSSKLLDDGSIDSSGILNPFDARMDRGVADYDVPQRFVASWTYELPFFTASGNRVSRSVLGGWTLAGIANFQSGTPFTPTWNGPVPNTGIGAVRPKRIGSGKLDNPTLDRWFDIAAFAEPDRYTYGNSGRNILRVDGRNNFDLAVYKSFRLGEGERRIDFRGEFFNAFNHPDFGGPAAAVNVATAGTVRSATAPRIIQLALKFYY